MTASPDHDLSTSPFDFEFEPADAAATRIVERAVVKHMRRALGLSDYVVDDEGNSYPRKPFSDDVEEEIDLKLLAEYHAGRLVVTT